MVEAGWPGEIVSTDAGATRAFMILLRLPTSVRPVFEERLRERFPLRADKVLSQLEACRVGQTSRASFGARMRGDFTLTAGQKLTLVVGQQGSEDGCNGGGGGGCGLCAGSCACAFACA